MSKEEKAVLETKIIKLKKEKNEIKGTPCEVYSRVVGYLRPVQSWNKGKQEEFKMRKHFNCPCSTHD